MRKPSFYTRFIKTFREQVYSEWVEGLEGVGENPDELQTAARVATEISVMALNRTIFEYGPELLDEQEG